MSSRSRRQSRREHPNRDLPHRCPDCGKRPFATRKIAAAEAAEARHRWDDPDLRYYRCVSGNGMWHIGHPPGWRRQQGLEPRPLPERQRLIRQDHPVGTDPQPDELDTDRPAEPDVR